MSVNKKVVSANLKNRNKDWNYEEADVREDVKTNLPDDWSLKVYKVRSGDSGEIYWCRIMESTGRSRVLLCDCPQGKFLAPLTVLGYTDSACKHIQNLLSFLKKEDS